ncbi:Protein kinase domain-containing protein [Caenorhabditis elegans]|uniref:Protein kinase domain-containing protein n=1 Tax=Caenorhabditis elegans TaxID=6239 RepID=O01899_CAEEL|nr:Protein kinase domain-containing protein [Caenorhabditis elegans]CCD64967.1 Protein kinase domain-containing protein [Caenorhabditis elegans]|eukprot:NP_495099.2 Uncharacterized protein CELE_F59E12.3 [Caenorhabditis elegans]
METSTTPFLAGGTELTTSISTYTINEKIAEGSFGAIFKVTEKSTGTRLVLKAELPGSPSNDLRIELVTMLRVFRSYVPEVTDKGVFNGTKFLIMPLFGKSLEDIIGALPGNKCSLSTAIGSLYQCLEAIELSIGPTICTGI